MFTSCHTYVTIKAPTNKGLFIKVNNPPSRHSRDCGQEGGNMKKLLKFLAAVIISVGALGASAAAAECSIDTTGPDSTNTCTNTQTNTTTITCDNNTSVLNKNSQNSSTGDAETSGNTTAGNATSGNASNSNSTNTSVDSSCGQAPAAPTEGGQGGGAPSGVALAAGGVGAAQAQAAAKAGVLPETGVNPLALTGILGATLGSAALASRLAASAFRRAAL